MSRVRSFRRAFGIAVAMLVPLWLLQPLGCATGGSADSDSGLGTADYDGEPPADTGPRPDGTPPGFDSAPPPFDGGVDTGHGGDTGVMDSGGMDTSAMDSSKPHKDAGPKDTGAPDTGSCVTVTVSSSGATPTTCPATGAACGDMTSISGFTPTTTPPTAATTTSCTTAQITTIFNDCLNTKTYSESACTKIATTDSSCYDCIFASTEGDSTYGPLITSTDELLVFLNQAGCIDLLEPCNSACSNAYQSAFQCELAACEPNCPMTADSTTFQTCIEDVTTCNPGGCDTYYTEYSNCGALLTGAKHPASVCVGTSTSTFEDLFKAIVPVFCGP
jgi:hypothetical protein